MSLAELEELDEVKALIANGVRVGVLSYSQIATATAEIELDDADLQELHALLERSQIELVEEIDPAMAATLRVERAPEKRTPPKITPEPIPDAVTDALGLFLSAIGKVPLLTAREEVALAMRIERGDLDAKTKIVESNLRLVVSIAKNYRNQGPTVSRHRRFTPTGGRQGPSSPGCLNRHR